MPRKSKRLNPSARQVHSDDNYTSVGSTSRSPLNVSCLGSPNVSPKIEPTVRELELERDLVVAKETIARLSRCNVEHQVPDVAFGPSVVHQTEPELVKSQPQVVNAVASLPRVELSFFDGNPVDYWKFTKQFDCHVESKTSDPGQRLLYLMYYCRGNARKAIDACVMLSPTEGYDRARRILKDLYGLPHVVARSLLDDLFAVARQVKNTAESLSNFALSMENCQIALQQMRCQSDLNCITTLEALVKCMPLFMQHQWADEADRIALDGYDATFEQLTEFVSRRARVARSRFGQLLEKPNTSLARTCLGAKNEYNYPDKRKVYMTTQRPTKPCDVCCLCGATHELRYCSKFIEADVKSRWEIAKKNSCCFVCLRRFHNSAACTSGYLCSVDKCGKRHNSLLHYEPQESKRVTTINCSHAAISAKVCLGSIPVKIDTPNGLVTAIAFLDSGSDTTLIHRDFVMKYGMPSSPAQVTLTTLGQQSRLSCSRLSFKIHSIDGTETINVADAFTVQSLPDVSHCPIKGLSERYTHLKGVDFPDVSDQPVTVLIGCDVPEAHWALEQRLGGRRRPFATKTLLGWILQGPAYKNSQAISCLNSSLEQTTIEKCIKQLYNAEFADLSSEGATCSRDDEMALRIVNESTVVDGHFNVPLPWKHTENHLVDNYVLAEKRLNYLRRRFERDENLFRRYTEVLKHHFEAGYIEDIPDDCLQASPIWYLPHHPVFNPKKPEKCRIVFDCAAKYKNTSLNDVLLQGPNLTTNLVEVLLRFRMHRYAVAADVAEMFLQVGVPPKDRDALRLLWWPNNDMNLPAKAYRMTVHPFGATSSPFCATYAMRKTVECFGHLFDEKIGMYIKANFYVDDCLLSVPTRDEAVAAIGQLSNLLKLGGFRLTKWVSNDQKILECVPLEDCAPSVRNITENKLPTERMLGVKWDASTDEFALELDLPERSLTRRGLLSMVSSLYDPLGLMSPWILPGKNLLQQTCKRHLGWDEVLPDEISSCFHKWMRGMEAIRELRVVRHLGTVNAAEGSIDVHIFGDASEIGYGAVAYGKVFDCKAESSVRLLFSKSRVNPLKAVSIPRLELSAAVLAVRIFLILKRALGNVIGNITFWTDSMIVLYYINNESTRFSTFVANRLTYIHDHTSTRQWRYVNTDLNPADIASRGATDLAHLQIWLNGPEYLLQPANTWPITTIGDIPSEIAEIKKAVCNLTTINDRGRLFTMMHEFSSWMKLLRSIAWLTRFKCYLLVMFSRKQDIPLSVGPLRTDELHNAEAQIIRLTQMDEFGRNLLEAHRANVGGLYPVSLNKLSPFVDEGILKVGGRLGQSRLDDRSNHPYILPKGHHVTKLLIRHVHILEGHASPIHTLSILREKYWVVNGLTTVKNELRNCFICKKLNARPGAQLMSDLPAVRVTPGSYPFANVGLDYFGPFETKRGRSLEKRYGCLFTCLQCRAVHIEMVYSLSTDSFLMAFSRFVGRRGKPENIYSDNGSNFIGADRILQSWINGLNNEKVANRLSSNNIQWHFNPPYASHRGGIWERLIRSIRRSLNAMCMEQMPSDEVLLTALTEVERILNNRPLVPYSSDDVECWPLCPNDLLLRHANDRVLPDVGIVESYRQHWKRSLYLASVFWKRWKAEYLPLLQARQKWLRKERNFRVDDVVLLCSVDSPKYRWPLGVVEQTIASADGLVRSVIVRTKNGVLTRDVRKVCLLEGAQEDEDPKVGSAVDLGPVGTS